MAKLVGHEAELVLVSREVYDDGSKIEMGGKPAFKIERIGDGSSRVPLARIQRAIVVGIADTMLNLTIESEKGS